MCPFLLMQYPFDTALSITKPKTTALFRVAAIKTKQRHSFTIQQQNASLTTSVVSQKTILMMGTHREPSVSSTGSEHRDSEYNFIHDASVISVHASLSTLLFSEKFSDMTIRCGGREFKAHRAIICTQSSFFDRAFSSDFRVSV